MKPTKGLVAILSWFCCAAALAQQAPLFEEIRTVSSVAVPVQSDPFTIATAGAHELTLTDLGLQLTPSAPATSLQLAVMRGAQVVTTLTAPGTKQVDLPVGSYVIRVAGQPGQGAGSGLFSASVRAAGAPQPVFSFNNALSENPPLVPANVRLYQGSATLPAGNYEAELVDLAFPQALASASVVVTRGASVVAMRNLPAGPGDIATFSSSATATYPIFALGDSPTATNAGLFLVRIRDTATNTVAFFQLLPVGRVASLGGTVNLPAGAHSLVAADLAFPAALAQLGALVARGSNVGQPVEVARLASAATAGFNVTAGGAHEVFGLAVPGAAAGGGALGVEVRAGSNVLYSAVRTAGGDSVSGTPVFSYPVDVPGADTYTATITDMQFPATLSTVSAAMVRGTTIVARRDQAGSFSGTLPSGRAHILVAAKPASGTGNLQQAGGLVGIQLTASLGGSSLLQATQGVAGVFSVRSFNITSTGDYRFTLEDLGFPGRFSEMAAAVTRGTERLGLIYGEGSFDVLQAPPGSYFINFLTRTDATAKAGTYRVAAGLKAAAPQVTLNPNPGSPPAGGAVDITWSTQNATSCVASGGWSGSRPTSGTERIASITSAATFTLTCSGAGGSTAASATVTPAASGADSGGGSLGFLAMLCLAALLLARRRQTETRV